MAKKMLIDATHAEETRVVVADGNKVEEFDFESENKRQLAGNIYLAKVTRVEPSLQAAFVDYGGNRHGFLAYSEIHPDYYQIPVADREALIAEELEYARQQDEEDEQPKKPRRRSRSRSKAAETKSDDAVVTEELSAEDADAKMRTAAVIDAIPGMDVVDLEVTGAENEAAFADSAAAVVSAPSATDDETSEDKPESEATSEDAEQNNQPADDDDASSDDTSDDDTSEAEEGSRDDVAEQDSGIESVAQEDVSEEIRTTRKPRPKRYKIQEVIKVRQILLVQVVKEERGNKGAALTTYLSLAGRYCVLMPNTARGGGISRKITNAADRKKLKEIANEIDVPQGAGLIVRTAGARRTKSEIKRDYEYLQRQWEQVRELTLKSIAPAPIYEEGDLVKRSIRDLYNREIDEVLIEGEAGYRVAKDFMKMIMPSHAKKVKHYADPMPLFARFQVESYLSGMFNPTVQLKSGGYIVIGITEALVAVDVNSGRATKEGSIEQTALNTNLEAAEEVARQMRLRDLAGLIVIDFIDMEERRNNNAVEKRLKDKLKTDRARIQVGRISGFGLLEMSRQRLRPGMLEASTQPCPSCHGTGLIRSDDSLALTILRQLEEEGTRKRSKEVLLKAPVAVINYLMNSKREHIAQIEQRYGLSVRLEADPHKVSPDFEIEKFKTATRILPVPSAEVVSMDSIDMSDFEDEVEEDVAEDEAPAEEAEADDQPRKRKRRRRRGGRGRSRNGEGNPDANQNADGEGSAEQPADAVAQEAPDAPETEATDAEAEKPKRSRSRTRTRKPKADVDVAPEEQAEVAQTADAQSDDAQEVVPETPAEDAPAKAPRKRRSRAKPKADAAVDVVAEAAEVTEAAPEAEDAPKPKRRRTRVSKKAVEEDAPEADAEPTEKPKRAPRKKKEAVKEPAEETAAEAPAKEPEAVGAEPAAPEEAGKPKRRGWWSLGRG
ncbi:Rne/Rng family ribonuclease [Litoreibacter roseus]|uniref:Ribonuclease E n=1 Tax=Litoreibacter roseus TaxID=2601869 RepID=A0A6N6JDA3_9RHOB|nr:Rne/Rng family ribonuclease [Litoreibacter roseus]GFE64135.1 ribonuclease E [Litoreibacter roseus]